MKKKKEKEEGEGGRRKRKEKKEREGEIREGSRRKKNCISMFFLDSLEIDERKTWNTGENFLA